jgi:hypothetical protein
MRIIKFFENWVSSTTWSGNIDPEEDIQLTSKDKIYYGVHEIYLIRNGKRIKVKAKFDTGARSSSIDFEVARQLGISDEIIQKCKELENVPVSKDISKEEQKKMEKDLSRKLKAKYPDIVNVQMSKSSSGFSVRAYISCDIEYSGRIISTKVNLRDRKGLTCPMLVGLKDML